MTEPVFEPVLAILRSDPAVQKVLGSPARIFEQKPETAVEYPFLTVGRAEVSPIDGFEDHRGTLHIWGRRDDRSEIRNLLSVLREALHNVDLEGFTLCRVIYSDLFTGPDGRTVHGIIRVRAMAQVKDAA